MGIGSTLLVTSFMLSFAHFGVPLSIPILIVVGLILGIARSKSGGLLLPMIIHFFHNLLVISIEQLSF
ncbi:CPBP family glutamic-type intramembrane protease [Thalassoglobus sp. JC818]|uniref:CPBP family glutamic-type intramembrane protease n=1 Tax=Thalassoglobus sp. JC818 TaxID=3232136 RepID=UPI0034575300